MDLQDTSIVCVLTLLLCLFKLGLGQWQVIGPTQRIRVSVGEDVVFSCFLSPETSAKAMEVRFYKHELSSVVHLYKDGKEQNETQMEAYQGRTELVKDLIENGNVSLRLKNITTLDPGLYGCWFSSGTYHQEAFWELQVSAIGLFPLVSISGTADRDIQLLCKSSGWFPQPTAKWRSSEGHNVFSVYKVNLDARGLFDVEASITVRENIGVLSCSIQHPYQHQPEEFRVLIDGNFFQPSSVWNCVSISFLVAFVILVIIDILLVVYCRCKKENPASKG